MKSMIVTYDLRSPGRNYNSLYEKLKKYPGWAKITESTWLLKTNTSCVDVCNELGAVIDTNDRLFVTESTGIAAWWNVICDENYLKRNL